MSVCGQDLWWSVWVVFVCVCCFVVAVPVIFYVSNAFALLSFLRLGQKWPRLMQQWEAVEHQLPSYRTHMERGRLAYDIKIIAIVVLMLSLSE